jgi:hypothetical protein
MTIAPYNRDLRGNSACSGRVAQGERNHIGAGLASLDHCS